MKKPIVDTTFSVNVEGGTPFIESRARVISGELEGLPKGKIMVRKTPLLPPGASDEDYRRAATMEIVDDEGGDDACYCEDCKSLGLSPYAWLENLQPWRRPPKVGRNDPCPCGSGMKYKRCCLA